MKTTIFALNEGDSLLPVISQLKELGRDCIEIRPVTSVNELKTQLLQSEPGLLGCHVIFSATVPESLPSFIAECRGIAPTASFITVLEKPAVIPNFLWTTESQLLTLPSDDFHLAASLATAIQQSALRGKLLIGNKKDEVDNLLSRPYFMHRLSEEISVSRRHKAPMCCVILSINYYRMYLDSYGYQFTNALLRFVGDEINRLVRYEDQVARVGDDELALLLSRCSEADAKKLIQRLADTLNSLTFQFEQYEEQLSVCAGVAAYPFADSANATPDILVRYAHHALHQAKNSDEASHSVTMFSEIRPSL